MLILSIALNIIHYEVSIRPNWAACHVATCIQRSTSLTIVVERNPVAHICICIHICIVNAKRYIIQLNLVSLLFIYTSTHRICKRVCVCRLPVTFRFIRAILFFTNPNFARNTVMHWVKHSIYIVNTNRIFRANLFPSTVLFCRLANAISFIGRSIAFICIE